MSGYYFIPDDLAGEVWTGFGSASTGTGEGEEDPAEAVRRVVEEVTGKPVPRKQRIFGFIPME